MLAIFIASRYVFGINAKKKTFAIKKKIDNYFYFCIAWIQSKIFFFYQTLLFGRKNHTCTIVSLLIFQILILMPLLNWLTAVCGVKRGPGVHLWVWQSRSGFERWCIFDMAQIHDIGLSKTDQALWISGAWLINKKQSTLSPLPSSALDGLGEEPCELKIKEMRPEVWVCVIIPLLHGGFLLLCHISKSFFKRSAQPVVQAGLITTHWNPGKQKSMSETCYLCCRGSCHLWTGIWGYSGHQTWTMKYWCALMNLCG